MSFGLLLVSSKTNDIFTLKEKLSSSCPINRAKKKVISGKGEGAVNGVQEDKVLVIARNFHVALYVLMFQVMCYSLFLLFFYKALLRIIMSALCVNQTLCISLDNR